ncbi:hypothetical protein [Silvibacterium acidisoli]|uniref:hypothetical protein n=1 Tax=Acidobacteriaceae bacterium ZG23-2 TaxID=2883246 RepID=UPI00406C1401
MRKIIQASPQKQTKQAISSAASKSDYKMQNREAGPEAFEWMFSLEQILSKTSTLKRLNKWTHTWRYELFKIVREH